MIVAIIQARYGSTRLPGKILMEINHKPILYYVINQVQNSKKIDNLVIATPKKTQDDQIAKLVDSYGVEVFRGSENDVLDRYYQCAKNYNADIIVRVTSDCPLIDPNLIDRCIMEFEKNEYDYISNTNKLEDDSWIYHLNGFPLGFGVEVFSFDALEKAWKNAKKPSEREHVTQYIPNNPKMFKIGVIENSDDFSDIHLSIDHKLDFNLIKIVIEHFPDHEIFNLEKIISFFEENPHLKQINSHISFNEGYLKSLKEDKMFKKKKNNL
jgi:spore coat polysaccharide biosynthesis protein SpsF